MRWRNILFILFLVLGGMYFVYLEIFHFQEVLISDQDRQKVQLMPLPSELAIHSGKLNVTSHLRIELKGHSNAELEKTVLWFEDRLKGITGFDLAEPTEADRLIIICDTAKSLVQRPVENESYSLLVFSHGARLRAATPYGIIRGLETFLQLVHEKENSFFVPAVEITDQPRFPWRGLLIDVARHWIPKEVILRNVEAMAAVKLNVLHLHLTDDQAWRIESKVFPELHRKGSRGKYYSHEDIQEIVAFAAQRGIRVIPELDMPGHISSWLAGYPQLASSPGPYQVESSIGSFDNALDPTKEEVYQFIDKLVGEWSQLFPDSYLHIGGHDVRPVSWTSNPDIVDFMEARGYQNTDELQGYFTGRVRAILAKYGKKLIGWDELAHTELGNGAMIQSRMGQKSLYEAVQNGNYAILSGEYFLDRKLPASYHYSVSPGEISNGVAIEPDDIWKTYKLAIKYQGQMQNPELTLFGPPELMRGVINLNGVYRPFDHVDFSSNNLRFSFESDLGPLDFNGQVNGDSLVGELSNLGVSKQLQGRLIGSSEIDGTSPPDLIKVEPFTDAQQQLILGGEACMWTDWTDARNIDSRIWPRLAVVAEKLWSPAELTQNPTDMYRRLGWISHYLDYSGANHNSDYPNFVQSLCPDQDVQKLQLFIDVLEESKFYDRMTLDTTLTLSTPLNSVVDVARPESLMAVDFNILVMDFLMSRDAERAGKIRSHLETWSQIHESLVVHFNECEKLQEIEDLSQSLAIISKLGLEAMVAIEESQALPHAALSGRMDQIEMASKSQAGVQIAVTEPIRELILAAHLPMDVN